MSVVFHDATGTREIKQLLCLSSEVIRGFFFLFVDIGMGDSVAIHIELTFIIIFLFYFI